MQQLIEARHAEVADLCRKYHVRRLEVFGSVTRNNFDPAASDLDFLVEFEPITPVAYAQAYFSLGYATVDDRLVWGVVEGSLPQLDKALHQLLEGA